MIDEGSKVDFFSVFVISFIALAIGFRLGDNYGFDRANKR